MKKETTVSNVNIRETAVNILTEFELKGASIDHTSSLGVKNQSLLTNTVYGVLRHRSRIDFILKTFSKIKLKKFPAKILNLLRVSVYHVMFLDSIPEYAIVNETVKLMRKFKKAPLASFTNATLRNIIRSKADIIYPSLENNPVEHISVFYSHPTWMVERWIERYGVEKTISICKHHISIPPISIRANALKCKREDLVEPLKAEKLKIAKQGLTTKVSLNNELFQKGMFYVQDEASQLIVEILSPQKGEKILDACAGPGGKAFHIYEMLEKDVSLTSVEISPKQIKLFKENSKRLSIDNINLQNINMLEIKNKFDRILLDVPCSGLGVLRRRPDAKWRKKLESIPILHEKQSKLLEHAGKLVKPGGIIVYSTCSTEPEENWDVVNRFLISYPNFSIITPNISKELLDENGAFNTILNKHKMDYMFAVKLQKGTNQ